MKADKLERSLRLANKDGKKEENDDLEDIDDILNGMNFSKFF